MLCAAGFGELAGIDQAQLALMVSEREVLAFAAGTGGLRLPLWQVCPDGSLLPRLSTLFRFLDDDPWVVYRFLTGPHPDFSWNAPLSTLRAGCTAPVLVAARAFA